MEQVKRYRPVIGGFSRPTASMCTDHEGEYVRFKDHEEIVEALQRELAGQNQHAQMILEAKNYWMDRALKAEAQKGLI